MRKNKKLPLVLLVILIIALPILLVGIKQTFDNRSRAAAADKLEVETGNLSGNATSQNDSNASGGKYILFGGIQSSTGVIGPQPTTSTPLSQGTKFVSPSGTGTTCTQASPCSLQTGVSSAINGDVIFMRGGTYQITQNLSFTRNASSSNPITFESYPGEWAILDGSSLATGTNIYIRVTGSYNRLRRFEIKNMPKQGIWIGGNYNTLDGLDVHHNKLSGIHIFSPYESYPYGQYGSYNQILNSKAHDNSDAGLGGAGQDYNQGGNADGISISSGEGNIVRNSIAEHNSDDGIDTWRSTNTHISYSISTNNGIDQGNGNGFKAGGASPSSGTTIDHSIAYNNRATGFDTNSGLNVTFNYVTSWNNDNTGFYTYPTTKTNNSISFQNSSNAGGNGIYTNNSWQRSGTPSFISTDPTNPNFLKPTAGGGFEDIGAYANSQTPIQTPTSTLTPTPIQTSNNDPAWAQNLKVHMTSLRSGTWTAVTAPSSIPHDGTSSSVNAFNNWIAGLPPGTKAIVPSGWSLVFDGDSGINLKGKNKIWLVLTGVNISQNTTGASNLSSAIFLERSVDIIVDGGTITGQMKNVGSQASWADVNEHINGVIMRAGSKYVEINGTSILANRGWPIFMAGIDGAGALADGLWVHNFTATGGETSVAIVAGQNAVIEKSNFANATYFAIDIEPDATAGTVQHMLIQNNTFDGWGLARGGTNAPDNYYFFAANPGAGTPIMDDYIVRNNIISRAAIGTATGQGMRFHVTGPVLRSNIVITGNVSSSPRTQSGGGSDFNNVNNLTVTGNTQKTVGGVPLVETDTNPSGVHIITPNNTQ